MTEQTDRELLEMAAKAAGIVGKWERRPDYIQDRWYFNVPYDSQGMLTGFEWNPLTEDADAHRLAVKLRIDVMFDAMPDGDEVCARHAWGNDEVEMSERLEQDPCAATRRAITRAAAEIGRQLP